MTDVKMTDIKLTDQMTEHEIAGHENDGHEIAGHEIAGHENDGPKLRFSLKRLPLLSQFHIRLLSCYFMSVIFTSSIFSAPKRETKI